MSGCPFWSIWRSCEPGFIRIFIAVFIGFTLCYFVANPIMKALTWPAIRGLERLNAQGKNVDAAMHFTGFMEPILVRYARNFGIPVAGMTARFLRNWGDLGTRRGVVQQTVEAAYSLAHGAKVIVGDHLHDDGRLVKCVYDDIQQTFDYV